MKTFPSTSLWSGDEPGPQINVDHITERRPRRSLGVAFGLAAALLAAATLSGCSDRASAETKSKKGTLVAVPVVVGRAEAKDVPVEVRNIGNVEAYSTVTIRSQITGQIIQVHFQEGQEVKAGDLLFSIDPRPAQGALRHAQADLKRDEAQLVSARLEFERQKKLLANSIASQDDYEKAQAAFYGLEATVMADQSAISNATLNLEYTSIRAPIDGRTGNLMVKKGNIVKAPDDSLVTINQVHPIYVTFSVPEQDLPEIRARMREVALPVQVGVPGDATATVQGELTFIDNSVDATTGRIKLKGTFTNENDVLWPGQFVQATLTLRTLPRAIVVPSHAVQSSQNGEFVFVVKADSTVQKRPVVIGLSLKDAIVIARGVEPGETVVTDGQLRLTEGAKVTTQTAGGGTTAEADRGGTP
jgi:multidrug efflux system membrane fusion protein